MIRKKWRAAVIAMRKNPANLGAIMDVMALRKRLAPNRRAAGEESRTRNAILYLKDAADNRRKAHEWRGDLRRFYIQEAKKWIRSARATLRD